jgi:hypothetical protein
MEMSVEHNKPVFITFTGADNVDSIPAMQSLSARYPIEWGVLIDPARQRNPLFPREETRDAMVRAGFRLSAHVCGELARSIVDGLNPPLAIGGFSRLQINHGRAGSNMQEILNSIDYGARIGVRPALQCQGAFPSIMGVDWLYDISFGTGVQGTDWPPLTTAQPFCGYSGGLGAENVQSRLQRVAVSPGIPYWIDMESGVRTNGRFDVAKCQAVCEAVFGKVPAEIGEGSGK